MATRPRHLLFASYDSIPLRMRLGMGLQHCFVMSSTLVMAALIAHAAGGGQEVADQLVRLSMIVAGLATIMQSIKGGPIGSGYLCPSLPGPSFLPASLVAAKTGGLSLLFGMLLLSGAVQIFLSRVLQHLRAFLPPEVTGVIVAMVGVTLVPLGISSLCGLSGDDTVAHPTEVTVGVTTLCIMWGFGIWSGPHLRLYNVLIGIFLGYGLAYAIGVFSPDDFQYLENADFFAVPIPHAPWDLQFDHSLILPFMVAAIASSIKALGVISTSQKIDDADWSIPDIDSIRGGILSNGLAVLASGLVGGMAPSPSASNVGVAVSTGVASRSIGTAAGVIFIAIAFSPLLAAAFVIMPVPVKGTVLIYVAGFMIVSGWQLVMSRPMDTRTITVVGGAIVAGLSIDFLPGLYAQLPVGFHAVTGSPLSFATVAAVGLNMIFRIGISQSNRLEFDLKRDSIDDLERFMKKTGLQWGVRSEVIERATDALIELVDIVLPAQGIADREHSKIEVQLNFDKTHLELRIIYDGEEIDFPDAPPRPDEIAASPDHLRNLSAYLVAAAAHEIKTARLSNHILLRLRFLH